ncbi:hypothetical protein MMC12_003244 [Toensbergia leucococca]|nr:hypothetical protein [Toensbergia leucococca]
MASELNLVATLQSLSEELIPMLTIPRSAITTLYDNGTAWSDRKVGPAIWIGFEHEGLHLETFLYMLLQSDRVIPPPEVAPDFKALARSATVQRVENQWFTVPANRITHRFFDPENDESPDRFFALVLSVTENTPNILSKWTGTSQSLEFQIQPLGRPRTVYGPVSLKLAVDWPAMASFNGFAGYAAWAGGRIPTFNEVRSVYKVVERQKNRKTGFEKVALTSLGPDREDIFVDLTHCNIGLKHFHPMPVTGNGDRLSGVGDIGGAWE